jgi:hypothetical protein
MLWIILGLVINIEYPKFQSEFEGATINFHLNCQLDNLQEI